MWNGAARDAEKKKLTSRLAGFLWMAGPWLPRLETIRPVAELASELNLG
jgi:hypothetical protein